MHLCLWTSVECMLYIKYYSGIRIATIHCAVYALTTIFFVCLFLYLPTNKETQQTQQCNARTLLGNNKRNKATMLIRNNVLCSQAFLFTCSSHHSAQLSGAKHLSASLSKLQYFPSTQLNKPPGAHWPFIQAFQPSRRSIENHKAWEETHRDMTPFYTHCAIFTWAFTTS